MGEACMEQQEAQRNAIARMTFLFPSERRWLSDRIRYWGNATIIRIRDEYGQIMYERRRHQPDNPDRRVKSWS